MTAVSLFDSLANLNAEKGQGTASTRQLDHLAGKLIEASLADFNRITDYECEFGPLAYDSQGLQVAESIYGLYEDWARDAEQILERVHSLSSAGDKTPGLEVLDDAYGRVRARLGLKVSQIGRSMDQIRRGEAVPIQELRNELLTRIRP